MKGLYHKEIINHNNLKVEDMISGLHVTAYFIGAFIGPLFVSFFY
jgi:hypothetical protein